MSEQNDATEQNTAPRKKRAKRGVPGGKGKGGRKPILDPQLVAGAIIKWNGNLASIARQFKVTRQSVRDLIDRHPSLLVLLAEARETRLDLAESALDRAVKAGEGWATCFLLKTQGKNRGYFPMRQVESNSNVQTHHSHSVDVTVDLSELNLPVEVLEAVQLAIESKRSAAPALPAPPGGTS